MTVLEPKPARRQQDVKCNKTAQEKQYGYGWAEVRKIALIVFCIVYAMQTGIYTICQWKEKLGKNHKKEMQRRIKEENCRKRLQSILRKASDKSSNQNLEKRRKKKI